MFVEKQFKRDVRTGQTPARRNDLQFPNGKKRALKKYDRFAINILAAFGEVPDQILNQLCNLTKFLLQK